MKFGPVAIEEADGAILAHSLWAGGRKIAKGTRLTVQDLTEVRADGLEEVVVARLQEGDCHEDPAAQAIGEALIEGGQGLRLGPVTHGRVNVIASEPGVVSLQVADIEAANRVHPGITIATVPPWRRLVAGGLAATVKIIPYAVPEDALGRACKAAWCAMTLKPPRLKSAILIETRIGPDAPPDKGRLVTQQRLARLGVALGPRCVVPHQVDAIAAGLRGQTADLILILTGSATSDIADTAPLAVVRAGGQVLHYGMPVDPGNLLFVGQIDGRPVIGLPGCARSPALNGADWVMERLICGVPVSADDIMGMGVGGLLKEIPERGQPRE